MQLRLWLARKLLINTGYVALPRVVIQASNIVTASTSLFDWRKAR